MMTTMSDQPVGIGDLWSTSEVRRMIENGAWDKHVARRVTTLLDTNRCPACLATLEPHTIDDNRIVCTNPDCRMYPDYLREATDHA